MREKNYIFFILIFTALTTSLNAQNWMQIGSDINGKAQNDWFGNSVSLSSDGSIVAIGAFKNDDNGIDAGQVRIYQNISGTWTQIGTEINGEAEGDQFGYSVSLNSDGSIVAIGGRYNDGNGSNAGHVRIYQNVSGTWTQIGTDIDGEILDDHFGISVSLSSDGSIVAIGAHSFVNDYKGVVRVFQNNSGTWIQIGSSIYGESTYDYFGSSLCLSSDGSILAIGADQNSDNGNLAGSVRIYQNISGTWTQIGSDIDGKAAGEKLGTSVSLNADGSIVAIGADGFDGSDTKKGNVRIYQNISGIWTQIGSDIEGEATGDLFGHSVSLSSDGSMLAIGGAKNDENGTDAGHVKVYKNVAEVWTQIGLDIEGEDAGDLFGYSVSLSSDGLKVAIGAFKNDGTDTDAGHVRMYGIPFVITKQPENQSDICVGEEVLFSVQGENIDTCLWQVSKDNGNNWIDLSNDITYSGTATDKLIVTTDTSLNNNQYRCYLANDIGNTTSDTVTLSFDTIDPVITSVHDNQILEADVNCEALLPDYTGNIIYTDNCDNNATVTQSPVSGTIITDATNQVTLTVTDNLGNETHVNFNVEVADSTNPVVTCVENQEVVANVGNTYAVTGTEFDPSNTSDNCEVSSVTNNFNNTATLAGASLPLGITTVVWTVTDAAGNSTTCSCNITVDQPTGINCFAEKGISVYPNPTNGIVEIDFGENNVTKIGITDISGRKIIESVPETQNEKIDLSDLDNGLYIIMFEMDKEIYISKILKE